jgi:hypothetical protein
MNPKLYTVYIWLSSFLSILMGSYLIYKYILAVQNRPRIQKSDILYQEWFASGSSMKNILTRFGGARSCLRLVVTKDVLWVTSWFPFSLITPFYDLEHVIPLNRITNIESRERFIGREVHLTYADTNVEPHSLRLIPRDEEGFLRAIADKNRGVKPNNSFNQSAD